MGLESCLLCRSVLLAAAKRTTTPQPLLGFIILVVLLNIYFTLASPQPRVVVDQAGLFSALEDQSVTHIQLANSITVSAIKGPGSWPLLLSRDCLVDGKPGSSFPRLDFNFATNDRVQLGPGVTVTFRGLVLSNAFSRSPLALDFFAPSAATAAIVWEGVVDRRAICRPLQEIRNAWSAAPRPADADGAGQQPLPPPQQQQQPSSSPPPQPQQQLLAILEGPNCNSDQDCYSAPVLRSYDVVLDSPAGYRLTLNNTLTVCEDFISQDCIAKMGSDLCYLSGVEALMARLHDGESATANPSSRGDGLSRGAQAGVIAGCVAGGALLLLLGGFLACRRRHDRCTMAQHSGGSGAVAFSTLDPTSPAGLQAFGSTRSTGTAASYTIQHRTDSQQHRQQQHNQDQQQQQQWGGKPLPGGKPTFRCSGAAASDGRRSHDVSTSTDVRPSPAPAALAAVLVDSGAELSYGGSPSAPASSGLRPSGSEARDLPLWGSHPVQAAPSSPPPPPPPSSSQLQDGGANVAASAAASGSTHSLGSAVAAMLRSILGRASSRSHLNSCQSDTRPSSSVKPPSPLPPAAASAAAALAALGSSSGRSDGGGGGVGSGAGRAAAGSAVVDTPRRVASLRSGAVNAGSARGSSAGQGGATAGSVTGRPSIGEIQEELERLEEHWAKQQQARGSNAGGGGGGSGRRGAGRASAGTPGRPPPGAPSRQQQQQQGQIGGEPQQPPAPPPAVSPTPDACS